MTNDFTPEQLESIELAFPKVNCPVQPFGNRVLVQIRLPKKKTPGGIIIIEDSSEDIYRNEQTAKVLAVGANCFTFPSSGESWPSGAWFDVGDYVRVPLHGGDNHWLETEDKTLLVLKTFKDYEIIGLIKGNPLDVKTNLAYF